MHRPMTTSNAFRSTFAVFPDIQKQSKKLQKSYQTIAELHDINIQITIKKEGKPVRRVLRLLTNSANRNI